MSFISLFISIFALVLSGINTYREFFYKKNLVFLTPADSESSDEEIKLFVVYTNAGNQPMNITNTIIRLNTPRSSIVNFDKANHSACKSSINPILIKENECKTIKVSYLLPDNVDYKKNSEIEMELVIKFTNKRGELCENRFIIGYLQTNKVATRPFIFTCAFKMTEGTKITGSISL